MANIYVGSVDYAAVSVWVASTSYVSTNNGGRGDYVRQLTTPALGSERVFRCTTSGTSLLAEPAAWTTTKNGTTTEALGPVWTECTGQELDQASAAWTAPHANLANAFVTGWSAAGDTYFVAANHAETQASAMTLLCPGTVAAPCKIICVASSGTVPPVSADLATTATISTTGANAITFSASSTLQNFYAYGITLAAGTGATNAKLILSAGGNNETWENCGFQKLGTTGISLAITLCSGAQAAAQNSRYINCTIKLGATSDIVGSSGGLHVFSSSATSPAFIDAASAVPTTLFFGGLIELNGLDLTKLGANTIYGAALSAKCKARNCKLAASAVTAATLTGSYGSRFEAWNCDSGDTNYRLSVVDYPGTIVSETVLVKTGGATDGDNLLSWKMVTVANAEYPLIVLRSPEIFSERITAVGSPVTITVDILHDTNVAGGQGAGTNFAFQNDEIWLEVQYLGTSGYPLSLIGRDDKADVLATAADQASSTATWTTTGMTTPVKQKLEVTFTPQEEGVAIATICVAKATKTIYIDPFAQLGTAGTSLSFQLPAAGQTNVVVPAGGGGGMIVHPGMSGGMRG